MRPDDYMKSVLFQYSGVKLHMTYQLNVKSLSMLSTIKDWDLLHQRYFCVVFARILCSAGIANENEFHNSSSPTLCASNDITSGHAHSLCSEIWLL